MDPATLRDLGLSTSEFGSCWVESDGSAEPTRRRVYVGENPARPAA
jgi:hypothetical protein